MVQKWLESSHLFGPIGLLLLFLTGCDNTSNHPNLVWGKKGVQDGDLVRPRGITIDPNNHLFIVDYTARIQVYDRDGNYLNHTWTTPDYRKGRPSGLGIDRDGNLLVCDSHYNCIRIYSPEGTELRVLGDPNSMGIHRLGYVSDVVQTSSGDYFLTEFGEVDRITQLNSEGKWIKSWGKSGTEPGEFNRPRAIALGPDNNLYVADSCNHRIQVFSQDGDLLRHWGEMGSDPGELLYPQDLAFSQDNLLYVVEYGNHRVQKFDMQGKSRGCWGRAGRQPGQFHCPWGLAIDRSGMIHVVDTENHRVQRFEF